MKRIIKIMFYGIVVVILYIFVAPLVLRAFGYYPDGVGWKVAQQIVNQKGEASDCYKIMTIKLRRKMAFPPSQDTLTAIGQTFHDEAYAC